MDYKDSRMGFLSGAAVSPVAVSGSSNAAASSAMLANVDAYKLVLSGRWSRLDFDNWLGLMVAAAKPAH